MEIILQRTVHCLNNWKTETIEFTFCFSVLVSENLQIFSLSQRLFCTTTSTSGPQSIWVTLASMRIHHGCERSSLRSDSELTTEARTSERNDTMEFCHIFDKLYIIV